RSTRSGVRRGEVGPRSRIGRTEHDAGGARGYSHQLRANCVSRKCCGGCFAVRAIMLPRPPTRVGEKVWVVPSHACATVNLHDDIWYGRHGRVDGSWKVAARGKVR